jgi:hypothetical protein
MEYKKHPESVYRHLLSMPFIYIVIVPIAFLDITLEIYHQVCFRLYKIPLIKRSQYIKIDRQKLKYLTRWERVNCAYCGYANGFAHYFSVIVAETEKYWCGIKHDKDPNFVPPVHHKDFIEYSDEEGYKN